MRANVGVMKGSRRSYKNKVGQISIETFINRSKGTSTARLKETLKHPEWYNVNYVRACKIMLKKRNK